MLSCSNNHTFTEHELAMPTDHDNYDHTSGRCPVCDGEPFEIEDGAKVYVDHAGILKDACPVNVLIGKDERPSAVSTAVERFAVNTGALLLLLFIGFMFAMSIATPDPRIVGKLSNDKPVMVR